MTIFHSDLPAEIRVDPYAKKHAGRLTNLIFARAMSAGLASPFALDRMDDRIVVRELAPADARRVEEAA